MKDRIRRLFNAELIRPETALAFAFLTPTLSYLIMFAMRGIYPFGDSTIFGSDLYHQYGPFLAEYRHKLLTGESLFYTWNMGMGMNFWTLLAYYLASPTNLLSVLVPQDMLVEFMTALIALKIGLCGLTMAWYLRRRCGTRDFGVALFGIFYAMSGYVTAYHWNVMWMDCIILFPLILWGLERLVYEKRPWAYCALLGLSIASNYYSSIMTCLFLILYAPVLLLLGPRQTARQLAAGMLRFAGYSLLAGGMCAVLLVPAWMGLQTSYAGQIQLPELLGYYFSPLQVLARHLANVRAEYQLEHWPNIYCGVWVLLLVPLYLGCRGIRRKERAVYGGLVLLLLFSFCFAAPDYLWHGLHFPNCFPAREAYLYVFLMLFMSYRAYTCLPRISCRRAAVICLGALAGVALARRFSVEPYFRERSYLLSGVYLLIYTSCFLIWKKTAGRGALKMVFAVVAVEALFTVTDNGMFDNPRESYTKYDKASEQMIAWLSKENSFFRMKRTPPDKTNEGAWLHYPAVNAFSSTNYFPMYELLHRLGCESNPNYYSSNGATPLVDMLLGVGWELSASEREETQWRALEQQEEVYLYRLETPFPPGFLVDRRLEQVLTQKRAEAPFALQNQIAAAFHAPSVLLMEGRAEGNSQEVSFVTEKEGEYYALVDNCDLERPTISFPERMQEASERVCETWTYGCLMELGCCGEGERIVIRGEGGKTPLQVKWFRFDGSGLDTIRSQAVSAPWRVTERTPVRLSGTIDCPRTGTFAAMVPYDRGWRLWVDGQPQKTKQVLGAFVGTELPAGVHHIRMKYAPPGLMEGALISIVSLGAALYLSWPKAAGQIGMRGAQRCKKKHKISKR